MGLITYASLLLLTPNILSLPLDPQDNAFLSWAHSYAAFHNWSNCWVCRVLHSSSWKVLWWTSPLQEKDFLQTSEYLRQQSYVMPLLHLMTSTTLKWTGATLCTLTMDIMWLLILIIHCLSSMTILLHIKQIGLDLMFFFLTFLKYGMRLCG